MTLIIGTAFDLEDRVYLITDPDQKLRLVTAICQRVGRVSYELSCGTSTSWHDAFEISTEKDIITSTSS